MSTNADNLNPIPPLHYWQDALRIMMRNSITLLRMAGEPISDANLIKLVESLPRSNGQLRQESWRRTYSFEVLHKAYEAARHTEAFREVNDYFVVYFPDRHFVAQEVLIDSVKVVLMERVR